jgi:threonylcarbamoyladenosine tRNA methylthiotransferase MtaB
MPTAAIYTLGCRLNQADAALMADDLRRHGYDIRDWEDGADVMILNSCTVTAAAAAKTRQALRAARRRQQAAFIVLTGCDVQTGTEDWVQEGTADLIIPNPVKTSVAACLPEKLTRPPKTRIADAAAPLEKPLFTQEGCGFYPDRTRANLKIQEGCDFHCSYCIVPTVRGAPRSRAWNDVLREARELLERGHRELVLAGVNIACYDDHGRRLPELLAELAELPGDFRLRLSSTEPVPLIPALIEVMRAYPRRVCRFLHLPLQYGEDSILRAMNRRYSVTQFAELVNLAAESVPGICIGSDVIVGFPGETEGTFAQCRATIEKLPLTYLHVFRYSPRPGTRAADLPGQVNGAVAAARHRQLTDIAQSKSRSFTASCQGHDLQVLTEAINRRGNWEGWSDNYLRVEIVAGGNGLQENQFVQVRMISHARDGRRVIGACKTIE